MMNREQRRKYQKRIKSNKAACVCPKCNHTSLFVSKKIGDADTAIVCECCGQTVMQDARITKSVPPGIYLPFTLNDFEKMLAIAEVIEKKKEEEETKDVLEGNEDCNDA